MSANTLDEPSLAARVVAGLLGFLWNIIGTALAAILILMEPLVSTALTLVALVGLLIACLFRFGTHDARFPFWGMLCACLACALALWGYRKMIRLLMLRG